MVEIDTLFQTETAETTYPLAWDIPLAAYASKAKKDFNLSVENSL